MSRLSGENKNAYNFFSFMTFEKFEIDIVTFASAISQKV